MATSPCNIKATLRQPMLTVLHAAVLYWIQCSRALCRMTHQWNREAKELLNALENLASIVCVGRSSLTHLVTVSHIYPKQ